VHCINAAAVVKRVTTQEIMEAKQRQMRRFIFVFAICFIAANIAFEEN
jgi:hypothetical protein